MGAGTSVGAASAGKAALAAAGLPAVKTRSSHLGRVLRARRSDSGAGTAAEGTAEGPAECTAEGTAESTAEGAAECTAEDAAEGAAEGGAGGGAEEGAEGVGRDGVSGSGGEHEGGHRAPPAEAAGCSSGS